MTLLECDATYYRNPNTSCRHAQVRCRNDQRILSVNAAISNTIDSTFHIVNISWMQNISVNEPTSFEVKCYNDYHSLAISVPKESSTTHFGGLLPSSPYNCCVSAVHENFTAKEICAEINTQSALPKTNTSSSTNTIGGVLGLIIVVLLALVVVLAIALVCVLRPDLKKKVFPER